MPQRIQRKRTIGASIPLAAIYVGRPTKWGNPFRVGTGMCPTVADAVECYRLHVTVGEGRHLPFEELRGKDLVCWCPAEQPCHAEILLELSNQEKPRCQPS